MAAATRSKRSFLSAPMIASPSPSSSSSSPTSPSLSSLTSSSPSVDESPSYEKAKKRSRLANLGSDVSNRAEPMTATAATSSLSRKRVAKKRSTNSQSSTRPLRTASLPQRAATISSPSSSSSSSSPSPYVDANASARVAMTSEERALTEKQLTPFMRRVYAWTKRIPRGQISTYGDIAKALGDPRCSRAVGTALKRNPFAPAVPCHRVLKSDMDIGGFFGATSPGSARVQRKLAMLRDEGIPFTGTKVQPTRRDEVLVNFNDVEAPNEEDCTPTALKAPIAL